MKIQKSKIKSLGLLSAFLIAGFNQSALAAFSIGPLTFGPFVEPSVTYEKGDIQVNYPSPTNSTSGDVDGFGVGARLGVHFSEIFFLGIDGRYSMPQYKDSAANYDESAVAFNWGPVAGVQMPIAGLRVWGSYIIGGELDPDSGGAFDVKFNGVDGYRIGAGIRVLITSLNLEYQTLEYDEVTLERSGTFTAGTSLDSVKVKNDSWVASVSFPIELEF